MSSEKRLILFTVVTFASILMIEQVMRLTGLTPPPEPKNLPIAKADLDPLALKDKDKQKDASGKAVDPAKDQVHDPSKPKLKPEIGKDQPKSAADDEKERDQLKAPKYALAKPGELVIGSTKDASPSAYHLQVDLSQRGAGVTSVSSARYDAEYEDNKPRKRPLQILRPDKDLTVPSTFALTILPPKKAGVTQEDEETAAVVSIGPGEIPLDTEEWEVVRDAEGRAVTKCVRPAEGTRPTAEGQQVVFRNKVDELGLTILKTFRIFPGDDGFDVELTFESPEKTQAVVYRLMGPHGIPIEGEWYTGTFRDALFGVGDGTGTKVITLSADSIVKRKETPELITPAQPLKYAGIENQYFTSFLMPFPTPTAETRWDAVTKAIVIHEDLQARQKADIGIEIVSKPVNVGPNLPVSHNYRVFAGPKTLEALDSYGAHDVAFRKTSWIPGAIELARFVITPLLGLTYQLTTQVSALFGGKQGNYGIAIILLTMIVRLVMFPLGRKQALSAKKMQDLQPHMKELQAKHKDDKEAQTRETWALYKRHGVNPVSGCLPALIQLPIFVGLWQALNNSVSLRHAKFLYIENLAAPDMLFKFPTEIPFLGNYFNALPFIVVALMLVQTKLFSPPATTPEAEAQQKMMKYMMIFMAFMFYKVPSGLGIYFITSSSWQICERLMLPKAKIKPVEVEEIGDQKNPSGRGGSGGSGGRGGNSGGPPLIEKPQGKFSQFWEKVLDEAKKNQTYRNISDEKDKDKSNDRRDREKGQPRARPDRRR